MVGKHWVGFRHVKVGGGAFGAEGKQKAWRQKITRVPKDQPVCRWFRKWGVRGGVM